MPKYILSPDEKDKLNEIVTGLDDFVDPPSRRKFIQDKAYLGRFAELDVAGDPRTVAADLIGKLERFGELPERPMYHALGALLVAILKIREIPMDDQTFVASLIVRYSLVADPMKISELRKQYNLTIDVARQPTQQNIPPPVNRDKIPPSPTFEFTMEDEKGLESVINSEDNFLNIYLLYGAIYCSQAVGRIEIQNNPVGTGFMVAPDLMLTNQHVLKDEEDVRDAVVRFGYIADASNVAAPGKVVHLQPGFVGRSPAEGLDYALVRLTECPLKDISVDAKSMDKSMQELVLLGKHRGYLTLNDKMIRKHDRVNIIQHPQLYPMKVVMTQNYVVDNMTASRVRYVADTMDGSSGSPVFNQMWEVVALHHSGNPYPPDSVTEHLKSVLKGTTRINEGIPTRAILEDFQKKDITLNLP